MNSLSPWWVIPGDRYRFLKNLSDRNLSLTFQMIFAFWKFTCTRYAKYISMATISDYYHYFAIILACQFILFSSSVVSVLFALFYFFLLNNLFSLQSKNINSHSRYYIYNKHNLTFFISYSRYIKFITKTNFFII